jgi:hypothetical protein
MLRLYIPVWAGVAIMVTGDVPIIAIASKGSVEVVLDKQGGLARS